MAAATRWKRQRQQSKREKLRDVINAVVRKVGAYTERAHPTTHCCIAASYHLIPLQTTCVFFFLAAVLHASKKYIQVGWCV